MKYNLLLLGFAFFIMGCSSDNSPPPPAIPGATNTEFVIGTNAYVTPNAYLLLDDAAGDYDRSFTFVFSDGNIIEDATNEVAFETSTTHFSKVTCELISTVATQAEIPIFVWPTQSSPVNIVMEGHHYSDTNITAFNNTTSVGSMTYGQVDASTNYTHTNNFMTGTSHPSHLFTVNSITVDLAAGTGTIDCSYTYEDDNSVTVTGVYVGTYEILTAF